MLETLGTRRVWVGGDWEFIHSNNSSPEILKERGKRKTAIKTRKVPTSLRALKWLRRSPCQRRSMASLGVCQPLNHAQGLSVGNKSRD